MAETSAVEFEGLFAVLRLQRRDPAPLAVVPARRRQLGVDAQMLADAVFVRDLQEIAEQLLALAEIARPCIARAERVGIGVVRRVDAAAGIAVDPPGAAKLGVLLDDGVGDAEMAERHTERDGADAGADDQHMLSGELFVRRPRRPARLARHKTHLLAHQRRVFRRDVLAEARAHHLQEKLFAGISDHRARRALGKQLDHSGADFVLDLAGHAGLGVGNEADVALGQIGRLEPARVAGHVHQHHQQAADVGFGNRGGEVERLAGRFDVHRLLLISGDPMRPILEGVNEGLAGTAR